MEYVLWIVINVLGAGMLASSKVEENRGLIIEKPNWKHVPERTIDIIFFFVVAAALVRLNQDSKIWWLGLLEILGFCLFFCVERVLLWKQGRRWLKILKEFGQSKKNGGLSKEQNAEANQETAKKEQETEKRIKILEEISFYMNSTIVYMIKYMIVFMLIEAIVFSILQEKITVFSEMIWVTRIKEESDNVPWMAWGMYWCIAGMMLSLYRIVSLLLPPEEKVSYNSYSRIKHNLEKGMVKN